MYDLFESYIEIQNCIEQKYQKFGLVDTYIYKSLDMWNFQYILKTSLWFNISHKGTFRPNFVISIQNDIEEEKLEETFKYLFEEINKKLIMSI